MKTFDHIRTFEQLDTAWVLGEFPDNSRKWKELYVLMHLLDKAEEDDYFYDVSIEKDLCGVETYGYLTLNNQYVSIDALRDHIVLAEEDGNYFAYVKGEGYTAKIYPVMDYCDIAVEKVSPYDSRWLNKNYRMRYLDEVDKKYHYLAGEQVWGYRIEAETDNLYKVSYTCLNHKDWRTRVTSILVAIYHLANNKLNEKNTLDRVIKQIAREIL